jgi:C1A family cysteine protease
VTDLIQTAADAAEFVKRKWGRKLFHDATQIEESDWMYSSAFLLETHLPGVSMRPLVGAIRDQGATSACTNFALSRSVATRAYTVGAPLTNYPSEVANYKLGQMLANPDAPLVDMGAKLGKVLQSARDVGMVSEARAPFDPDTITEPLPWDVYRAGSSAMSVLNKGLSYYRVFGSVQAKQALSRNIPLVIGMSVDESFMKYDGGTYVRGGAVVGGHAMTGIGYRAGCLELVNSWGEFWGESGFAWLPLEYLDSPSIVFEVYAIDIAPRAVV